MNQLEVIDTTKNDAESSKALAYATSLSITTPEEYRQADLYCKGLFDLRKSIQADFADSVAKAKAAKKAATDALSAIVDQEESHTKPAQEAERIIKTKLFAWDKEQEDMRRKEQDRLRAEAFRKAEDEKIKKAEALQAQGKTAAAVAELEKPVKTAPIILPEAKVKSETKMAEYWSYEIVDPAAVNRDFCKPDAGVIQSSMNAYKKQGKTIEEVQERIGGIRIEAKIK